MCIFTILCWLVLNAYSLRNLISSPFASRLMVLYALYPEKMNVWILFLNGRSFKTFCRSFTRKYLSIIFQDNAFSIFHSKLAMSSSYLVNSKHALECSLKKKHWSDDDCVGLSAGSHSAGLASYSTRYIIRFWITTAFIETSPRERTDSVVIPCLVLVLNDLVVFVNVSSPSLGNYNHGFLILLKTSKIRRQN